MRGRTYSKPSMTRADGYAQMMLELYSCRRPLLDHKTVDGLVARFNVSAKVAECALIVARQKRAGEV